MNVVADPLPRSLISRVAFTCTTMVFMVLYAMILNVSLLQHTSSEKNHPRVQNPLLSPVNTTCTFLQLYVHVVLHAQSSAQDNLSRLWQIIPKKSPIILFLYS